MAKVELVVTGQHYKGGLYTETFHAARYSELSDEKLKKVVYDIYKRWNNTCEWDKTRKVISIIRVTEDGIYNSQTPIL